MKRILFFCWCVLWMSNAGNAQLYPKGYFRSPLDIPLYLSGSFGELRSNHFHTGLDIKTNGVEGLKVYAIADGFISRIGISYYGYGWVLYMDHPNGYRSVYGHLSRFAPKIENYVREQQYKQKTEIIKLDSLPSDLLSFKKGEIIAYTGNTGHSGGPHLHFEIRETATDKALNPWLFGFDIKDDIKPTIHDIKVYPLNDSTVVNGKAEEKVFAAVGSDGKYKLKDSVIYARGPIGFAIHTIDMTNNSMNKCGVYEVELFLGDSMIFKQQMSCIDFNTNRYINAHMDYYAYRDHKHSYHKSFIDGNNQLDIYPVKANEGWITVDAKSTQQLKYIVRDLKGNTSVLRFTIAPDTAKAPSHLVLKCEANSDNEIFYPIHWESPRIIKFHDMEISIPKYAIYNEQCLRVVKLADKKGMQGPVFQIGDANIPMQEYMDIALPVNAVPDSLHSRLLAVYINGKGGISAEGGHYENGHVHFKTRAFGKYSTMLDTTKPVITPVNISEGKITSSLSHFEFKLADNLSGIKKYELYVDDKWLLSTYDPRKGKLRLDLKKEPIASGEHQLLLKVSDERGNLAIFTCRFTH